MLQYEYWIVNCDSVGPTVCESQDEADQYLRFVERRGGCDGTHNIKKAYSPDWDLISQQVKVETMERARRISADF